MFIKSNMYFKVIDQSDLFLLYYNIYYTQEKIHKFYILYTITNFSIFILKRIILFIKSLSKL
jgi:hypothetical protein